MPEHPRSRAGNALSSRPEIPTERVPAQVRTVGISPCALGHTAVRLAAVDRDAFPAGFFDRSDESDDRMFYAPARLVTHIDEGAIAAVGMLYDELGLDGRVLDLMGSWVSHFRVAPAHLTVLGMNPAELAANDQAASSVVHDLNAKPRLPFADASFDAVVCCVSVDYLVRPVEVFTEVARVVRPGGPFVCTFSNRCFPTKAIRGWLLTTDDQHCEIVAEYFRRADGWDDPRIERRTDPASAGDPLFAVTARRSV
jgi:SAM-dependent methyltransferase